MAMREELKPYKLVLFDVDHTLLDFDLAEHRAIEQAWSTYFSECSSKEQYREVHRDINTSLWREVEQGNIRPGFVRLERSRRLLARYGLDESLAEVLGDRFLKTLSETAVWLTGAEAAFAYASSHFKVGLVTNGLCAVQYPRVDSLGIRSMLSTYQISEEVGVSKPHPEMIERAIKEGKVEPSECLMVGDSLTSDYQGAINAGVDFCWLNTDGKALPSRYPVPQFVVKDLRELFS